MSNIEVGSAFVSVYAKTDKLQSGISKSLSVAASASAKLFNNGFTRGISALSVAAGNIISKVVGSAFNQAMAGVSSGIQRSDVLRQFPLVMESLGYSANDASDSIKGMMEHLQGLPTSTQDMASFVQQLTATTGNLTQATKLGLAFNDMLLAAGTDTQTAVNAQQMFNKMLATGTFNAQRWQAIQAAMPGQLQQVAQKMLGATATAEDLGSALSSGAVSFDDLTAAIIEMDENGEGAFASFYDQAVRATGGIGTALTNMTTRIGAGWQYVIDLFGNEEIASVITAWGNGLRDVIKTFGDIINQLFPQLSTGGIAQFAEGVTAAFERVQGAMRNVALSSTFRELLSLVGTVGNAFGQMFQGIRNGMEENAPSFAHLKMAVNDIMRAIEGFVNSVDWNAVGSTIGGAFAVVADAIATAMGYIGDFINGISQTVDMQGMLDGFIGIFTTLADVIGGALSSIDFAWLGEQVGVVLEALSGFFESIQVFIEGFADGWNSAMENVASNQFSDIIEAIAEHFSVLIENVSSLLEAIAPFVGGAVAIAVEAIGTAIDALIVVINNIIAIVMNIPGAFQTVKDVIMNVWNALRRGIASVVRGIKTDIATVWKAIKTAVTTVINAIKTVIMTVFNTVKTFVTTVWNGIKTVITTVWNGIKTAVSTAINAVKSTVSTVFNAIKSVASNVWNGIKTTISNVVNGIKTTVTNVFNTVKSTVSRVWNGIKDAISKPITAARDTVKGVIDKIKGFFNFTFKWPSVPLPHFAITPSGWKVGDLLKGTIPKLGIEWYATGGIVNGATLIGAGERGAEAIIPLTNRKYVQPFAAAIADEMGGANPIVVNIQDNKFEVASDMDVKSVSEQIGTEVARQLAGRL